MGVVLENGYEMKTTFWDDFTIADCEAYLNRYPYGEHSIEVKNRMKGLAKGVIKVDKKEQKSNKPVKEALTDNVPTDKVKTSPKKKNNHRRVNVSHNSERTDKISYHSSQKSTCKEEKRRRRPDGKVRVPSVMSREDSSAGKESGLSASLEWLGKKKSKNIAYPRMLAMYLARMLTDESFPRIGLEFGGRDHSTVIHAVDKITEDLKDNKKLQEIVNEIKAKI